MTKPRFVEGGHFLTCETLLPSRWPSFADIGRESLLSLGHLLLLLKSLKSSLSRFFLPVSKDHRLGVENKLILDELTSLDGFGSSRLLSQGRKTPRQVSFPRRIQ